MIKPPKLLPSSRSTRARADSDWQAAKDRGQQPAGDQTLQHKEYENRIANLVKGVGHRDRRLEGMHRRLKQALVELETSRGRIKSLQQEREEFLQRAPLRASPCTELCLDFSPIGSPRLSSFSFADDNAPRPTIIPTAAEQEQPPYPDPPVYHHHERTSLEEEFRRLNALLSPPAACTQGAMSTSPSCNSNHDGEYSDGEYSDSEDSSVVQYAEPTLAQSKSGQEHTLAQAGDVQTMVERLLKLCSDDVMPSLDKPTATSPTHSQPLKAVPARRQPPLDEALWVSDVLNNTAVSTTSTGFMLRRDPARKVLAVRSWMRPAESDVSSARSTPRENSMLVDLPELVEMLEKQI